MDRYPKRRSERTVRTEGKAQCGAETAVTFTFTRLASEKHCFLHPVTSVDHRTCTRHCLMTDVRTLSVLFNCWGAETRKTFTPLNWRNEKQAVVFTQSRLRWAENVLAIAG
jgi:hypothetical protein